MRNRLLTHDEVRALFETHNLHVASHVTSDATGMATNLQKTIRALIAPGIVSVAYVITGDNRPPGIEGY
jgi:hypothetical protein